MQHTTTIPILLALSIVTACGDDECLPTINADTLIAPVDPICVTTDALSTGGEASSEAVTGGLCEPVNDAFICAAVPEAGTMWGPCDAGACLGDAVCIVGLLGEVCAPACDDCGCPNLGCFGGTCTQGACVPECNAVGDPCPAPGMLCDFQAGACVWPVADGCAPKAGEAWGPCDGGACSDGSVCVGTATADICAMPCGGGNVCEADVCIMPEANLPTCGGTGFGEVCLYQCTGITDCAAGQTCTVDGCLWPK